MQTLFLEKKALELRVQRACLMIYEKGKKLSSLPLKDVQRVVVGPEVHFSAKVLGVFGQWGIALLVINHRFPERTASMNVPLQGDTQRRLQQYALYQDEAFRLMLARRLVQVKLMRQFQCLCRLKQQRADQRRILVQAMSSIRGIQGKLTDETAVTMAVLRGMEGAAAAVYFKAFASVFPPALGFLQRNRRPPEDPVSACLSLTYTLLLHETVNALRSAGLDSTIGCFHEVCYQRDSLACDVLDLLRPWADGWVFALFNQGILRADDFVMQTTACVMRASGKQRFYQAWQPRAEGFRRVLRGYARYMAKTVEAYEIA